MILRSVAFAAALVVSAGTAISLESKATAPSPRRLSKQTWSGFVEEVAVSGEKSHLSELISAIPDLLT